MVDTSAAGRLLVSVPDLGDDNFDRTVVFVVDHDDGGALGLVLNRPGEARVLDHLPDLGIPVIEPAVFFAGGPVAPGAVLVLGRRAPEDGLRNAVSVSGPVVVVDVERLVEADVDGVDGLRLFSGYSGWGPGQLDGELEAGVWHVADASPDDVLCARPEDLWRSVLRRQGGRTGTLGLFPDDPNLN